MRFIKTLEIVQALSSSNLLRFWIYGTTPEIRRKKQIRRQAADMGRVTNTVGLPSDRISAWRRFCSSIGPSTKAKTRGAGSYLIFRSP